MKPLVLGLVAALIALAIPTSVLAQSKPEFKLGFKELADQIPEVVGYAIEDEHWGSNGDSLQQTSTGLMVWRKSDNWTAFTNGSRTWILGPSGVQDRANEERFAWEPAAQPASEAGQPSAPSAEPASAASPTASSPSPNLKVCIDTPTEGARLGLDLKITGWAFLSDKTALPWNGIDGFRVFIDGPEGTGRMLNPKVTRMQRPDVAKSFGNPAFANSGFQLEFNRPEVPQGEHSLFLYIHSAAGDWQQRIDVAIGPLTPLEQGWAFYDKSSLGFSIALPPGWEQIDMASSDLGGEITRALRPYPELSNQLLVLAFSVGFWQQLGGVFLGFNVAPDDPKDFAATAELTRYVSDPVENMDDVTQEALGQLQAQVRLGKIKELSHRRLMLPGGETEEFRYTTVTTTSESSTSSFAVKYLFLSKENYFQLDFTTDSGRADQYSSVFEKIARSFYTTTVRQSGATL